MFGTIILFLIISYLILWAVFSFTPQTNKNKKETATTTNWEYQQEQSRRESEAERNKEWFSKRKSRIKNRIFIRKWNQLVKKTSI